MNLSNVAIKAVMDKTGLDSYMAAYFINTVINDRMPIADIELDLCDTIVDLIVKGVMVYMKEQGFLDEETPSEKKARRERIVS